MSLIPLNGRGGISVGPNAYKIADTAGNITANTIAITTPLPVSSGGLGVGSITGLLKGAGVSSVVSAIAGTDYVSPTVSSTFSVKQIFPAASAGVSGSINIPVGSGNTAVSGDLFALSTGIQWHNGTTVKQMAYSDGTNSSGTWGINTSGTSALATSIAGGVAGAVHWQSAAGTTGFTVAGSAGQLLQSNGVAAPSWISLSSVTVGIANNIAGGSGGGQVLYQNSANQTLFVAAGAAGQVLLSNGTAAPSWTYSVPSLSVGYATNAGNSATATYLSASAQVNIILGLSTGINPSVASAQGSFICRAPNVANSMAGITMWNDAYATYWGVGNDGAVRLGGWSRAQNSLVSDASGNLSVAGVVSMANASAANQAVSLGQANGLYSPIRTANVTPVPVTGVGITVSHGLGYIPFFVGLEYVNLVAEGGYSVGDVVQVTTMGGSSVTPIQYIKTATTVQVPMYSGNILAISLKTTGALYAPTPANWAYRFSLR